MYWFNYFHDTVCTRVFDWQILDTKQLKVFTHMQDFKVKKKKKRNRHPSISNVYFQISCYKIYSSKLRQRFSFGYTMLRTHHSLAKKKKNPVFTMRGESALGMEQRRQIIVSPDPMLLLNTRYGERTAVWHRLMRRIHAGSREIHGRSIQ